MNDGHERLLREIRNLHLNWSHNDVQQGPGPGDNMALCMLCSCGTSTRIASGYNSSIAIVVTPDRPMSVGCPACGKRIGVHIVDDQSPVLEIRCCCGHNRAVFGLPSPSMIFQFVSGFGSITSVACEFCGHSVVFAVHDAHQPGWVNYDRKKNRSIGIRTLSFEDQIRVV